MSKNKEIETQVKIKDSEPLSRFLVKNADFKAEKHQIDEYFTPLHHDFTNVRPVKEWFTLIVITGTPGTGKSALAKLWAISR